MEKIDRLRKGNIWVNVFRTDEGEILMTINRTYMDKNGEWKVTQFLNPRRGDVDDLRDALVSLHELEKVHCIRRGQ